MNALRVLANRALCLLWRSRADCRLDEELRSHFDLLVEQNLSRGLSPDEARRAARLSLGGADQIKQSVRDHRGFPLLDSLAQDIRFAARTLRKSPGFAAVAILTLALGIGANTAMFSIVNAALLQRMPFPGFNRVVSVSIWGYPIHPKTDKFQTLDELSNYSTGEINFAGEGAPERISAAQVTQNFFGLLHAYPILGRTFSAQEESAPHPITAILSNALWREHFHSDPKIIGTGVELNGAEFTVVGVMPPGFEFPNRTSVWVTQPDDLLNGLFGGDRFFALELARLRPGATLDQARAELTTVQLRSLPPHTQPGDPVSIVPLRETMVSPIRPALLLLFGAAGLVLLIACANVANLILARGTARFREFAVRSAMGASRGRLIRQSLTESVLLSLIGSALGLLIGAWSVSLAGAVLNTEAGGAIRLQGLGSAHAAVGSAAGVHLDFRVFFFALAAALLTGVLTGFIPALQSSRPNLNGTLKDGAADLGRLHVSRHRLGNLLSVCQIAAALVLLVGAGLLLRSLGNLLAVNLGFRPAGIEAAQVALFGPAYKSDGARLEFYQRVRARTLSLPGVLDAAWINALPFAPGGTFAFAVKAKDSSAKDPGVVSLFTVVSPGYFHTMGIPFLAGRDFTDADRRPAPPADSSPHSSSRKKSRAAPALIATGVIVSRNIADRLWPGQNPIGKQVDDFNQSIPVIGVVGNIHTDTPVGGAWAVIYFPLSEQVQTPAYLVVRSTQPPAAMASALRGAVASVDKSEPISQIMTMHDLVSHSISDDRFRAALLGLFAAIALLLAVIGIYGVISYSVGQRTREIGIRVALGAERRDILRLVLRGGALLVAAGIAIGLVASLALAHLLTHYLFGVRPSDPITFIGVALVLLFTALAACYIPARRAMHVDPLTALRHE